MKSVLTNLEKMINFKRKKYPKMYRSTHKILNLFFFLIVIASCDSFNTKVPASEIKKASAWSDADQFPSFDNCEGLEGEQLQKCFGDTLGERVTQYLATQELIADRAIDAEIILVITIDKEGAMTLNSVEDPNYVLTDVSGLEDILTQAVAQVPNALPAVKTNADARVSVSLKLPVQIVAQPAE